MSGAKPALRMGLRECGSSGGLAERLAAGANRRLRPQVREERVAVGPWATARSDVASERRTRSLVKAVGWTV